MYIYIYVIAKMLNFIVNYYKIMNIKKINIYYIITFLNEIKK